MNPKELLQIADSELDRITKQLIGGESAVAQATEAIESLTERLITLRQDGRSPEAADLLEILQSTLTKAKRVQDLLEAGAAFHCDSIFRRTEMPDTYSCDGTFSASQDSRIIFEG